MSLCLFFLSNSIFAHQPDISSTILAQTNEDAWVLQVRSALTAFEFQIKNLYGENSYKTPEEFKALVQEHLKRNISLRLNDAKEITLDSGVVNLAHETNVIFKIKEKFSDFQTIEVINSSFADIHKNQSALIIVMKGFDKQQFILSQKNNHQINLSIENQKFILKSEKATNLSRIFWFVTSGIILLALTTLLVWRYKKHE